MNRSILSLLTMLALAVASLGADRPKRLPSVESTTNSVDQAGDQRHPETLLFHRNFEISLRKSLAQLGPRTEKARETPDTPLPSDQVRDEAIDHPHTRFELSLFTQSRNEFFSPKQDAPKPLLSLSSLPTSQLDLPPLPAEWTTNDLAAANTTVASDRLDSPLTVAEQLDDATSADPQRIVPEAFLGDFSTTRVDPAACYHDSGREAWVYDSRANVPTQHPWIEWGRIWYGDGITPRGRDWFGPMNMVRPKFYVYGDFRTGVQSGRNAAGRADNWANRLNLDLDLQLTDTERFHAFIGPLDKQNRFTRYEYVDDKLQYRNEMNWTPATAFFEGDLGVMLGALDNQSAPFDLPISAGLMPLLFQNGIWMEDAVTGVATSLAAKHSRLLNWSNYDVSFFALFDQINSPAFIDNNDAQAFGTAWFVEAYGGYIESGYAYLNNRNDKSLSYHNATLSFTRRYFDRISNSVRVIVNAGQDRAKADRTADGGLLLVENSLITAAPLTIVPYANFFYGWNRPQSVARAAISGGILRNTGINFDTDGLNGFATLDTTAADTAGGSIGVDLIGDNLDEQLLVEFSYLTPHGDLANAQGDQYAVGARYQFPISNATLLRFDVMHGWRGGQDDVYGTRMEYRWKF